MPDSAPRSPMASELDLTYPHASSSDGATPRPLRAGPGRRTRWAVAGAAVALVLGARIAQAGPRIAISAGTCPNRDAMIFALAQVVPSASIVLPTEALLESEEPMAVVTVSNDAATYQVQVGSIARTFSDAAVRCEDRAGKAAVVVALALEPPQVVIVQPGAVPPAPDAAVAPVALAAPAAPAALATAAAPSVPPHSAFRLWLEVGAAAEYARPRSEFPPPQEYSMYEGTLRFAVDRGDLGLVLGVAALGWVRDQDGPIGVQRVPIELLLRLRHSMDPFAFAFDAGPALVFQRITTGTSIFTGRPADLATHTDAELDLRGGVRVELRSERGYGAYLGVTGAYVPRPQDLYGAPKGWIGATAGLMIRAR
jgi:hypothetical protein